MSIILLSFLKTQLSMMGLVFVSFTMTMNEFLVEGAEFEARPIPVEPAEEKEDE